MIWDSIAYGSLAGAGLIAVAPTDAIDIIGFEKWPLYSALIGLAAFSIWMSFKSRDKDREALVELSNHIGKLAENLAQRPCVRDPKND